MKLNLGGGKMKLDGWTNVDIRDADICADIRALPIEDNSIDQVLLVHVIEHFTYEDADKVLKEIYRVLKRGKKVTIEAPDILETFNQYSDHVEVLSRHVYGIMPENGDIGDCHKSGWTAQLACRHLTNLGFIVVSEGHGILHGYPQRDFRVEAVK